MKRVDVRMNCRIQLEQLTVQQHHNVRLQRPDDEALSQHGVQSVNKHHVGTHRWVGVHRVFLPQSRATSSQLNMKQLFPRLSDCALGRVIILHCYVSFHKQVLRFHVISGSWKSWRRARKVSGTEQ